MERISGMWQNMQMEPILFFDMIYSDLIVFLEKKVKKSVRRFGDNKICCTFALPFRDPRV